jgi:inosine-uridine nucleoside N-ribohydrolase
MAHRSPVTIVSTDVGIDDALALIFLGQGDGTFMHDVIAAAVWAGLLEADWRAASVREAIAAGPRRGMIAQGAGGAPVEYAWRFDAGRFLALWHEVVAAL